MEQKTKRYGVYLSDGLVARIAEWRRRQSDLPNFTEAVRRLVERGLAPEGEEDKRDE